MPPTDRQIMQQALEALEADEHDMVPDQEGHMVFRKEAAITALRERLAQPEQSRAERMRDAGYTRRPTLREIASEDKHPEQEPVADVSAWWTLVMGAAASIEDALNCMRDEDAKRQAIGAMKHYREKANALYTNPQPRQWVGLTDEQIRDLWIENHNNGGATDAFARAIEAKLKEKNT